MNMITGDRQSFLTSGAGVNEFNLVYGVTRESFGKFYDVDVLDNRILRMDDLSGTGWITFGSLAAGLKQFSQPNDIAVDAAGLIYVTDSLNNRVVRISNMTGAGWLTRGSAG